MKNNEIKVIMTDKEVQDLLTRDRKAAAQAADERLEALSATYEAKIAELQAATEAAAALPTQAEVEAEAPAPEPKALPTYSRAKSGPKGPTVTINGAKFSLAGEEL